MAGFTWPRLLTDLLAGVNLTAEQTEWAMDRIMSGEATSAQLAAFAVALRAKGETAAEVAGLVSSMLAHCVPVEVAGPCVDIVGTGGDQANTVNISSMAAVVAAAAGATVVKHGNRAASSACGAADLLEGLGVAISLPAAGVAASVAEAGIGFCFAPVFHPSYRHAGPPRREIGIPTVFNFLGPLTNPARPPAGAIGCGNARMAPVMAQVLADRGTEALVFRGDDGIDELTTTTTSTVWEVRGGAVRQTVVDPAEFGIPTAAAADLRGGDVQVNVAAARRVFGGQPGPALDAVLLNAAAAIAAHTGLTGNLTADLAAGLQRARTAVDTGAAVELMDRWASVSQRLASS